MLYVPPHVTSIRLQQVCNHASPKDLFCLLTLSRSDAWAWLQGNSRFSVFTYRCTLHFPRSALGHAGLAPGHSGIRLEEEPTASGFSVQVHEAAGTHWLASGS